MAWYCLQVHPKKEETTARVLRGRGYKVECPMIRNDRRVAFLKAVSVMFPGYLFICLTQWEDDFHPVERTTGVYKFVRFKDEKGDFYPTKIPEGIIRELKARADVDGVHSLPKDDYSAGDSVKIKSGVFQGYEAIFECSKAEDRIFVFLNLVGRLELLREDVEPKQRSGT
jgi:transcriptional antiterminator RfaH